MEIKDREAEKQFRDHLLKSKEYATMEVKDRETEQDTDASGAQAFGNTEQATREFGDYTYYIAAPWERKGQAMHHAISFVGSATHATGDTYTPEDVVDVSKVFYEYLFADLPTDAK